MNRKTTPLALALALAFFASAGHANDVVEIQLRGHYFAEPATVRITVVIEPDEKNRLLRIEADGERFYRASELVLSGAGEARVHNVMFKNLPAGSYELRAGVFSSDELRGMATEEVIVTGAGGR